MQAARKLQKYGNEPTVDKIQRTAITVTFFLDLACCLYPGISNNVRSLSKPLAITVKLDTDLALGI